jgi:hypothetical protein
MRDPFLFFLIQFLYDLNDIYKKKVFNYEKKRIEGLNNG